MPTIKQDNWDVSYYWTASSGLRLGPCRFNGVKVLHAATVPFIFVNYIGSGFGPYTDQLRSNAKEVDVRDIVRGFDLAVTYDWYGPDYRYDHIWRFYEDGQFGSFIIIHGPGEEIEGKHTYHIPFRFDLDVSGAAGDSFQRWEGFWVDVLKEGKQTPSTASNAEYDWQVVDKATGRRAMIRAGRRDGGEAWPLRYSAVERWSSWGGAQEAPPGAPGSVPAIYDNKQSVQDANIVVWYLAHVSSADVVAACGPWFKVMGFGEVPVHPAEPHDHDHGPPHHHDDHGTPHGHGPGTPHGHDHGPPHGHGPGAPPHPHG